MRLPCQFPIFARMFRVFYIGLFIFFFSGISAQENAENKINHLVITPESNIIEGDSIYNIKGPPQKASLSNVALISKENKLIKTPTVADSKVVDEIEPMYDFDPATVSEERILRQWSLSKDFLEEEPVAFDTLFSLFNRYRIVDLYSPVNAQLGNYGLPYYPLNFFDRISDPDKFVYSGLYHYMHTSESTVFMDVQAPFTELKWTIGGQREKAEQTFRVKHSQNINSKLNFGLIFDVIFSLGQYTMQRSEDKTFTFFTSYTGNKYKLYFSAGVNNLLGQENGGRIDELDINIQDTKDIRVNLGTYNNANSAFKNRNLLAVQRFTFFGTQSEKNMLPIAMTKAESVSGTFSHIFQLDYSRRKYSESQMNLNFYDSVYHINSNSTFDSLSAVSMKNTFRFDFTADVTKSLRYVAGFGLRNENFWFGQIIPLADTIGSDTVSWFKGNNVLLGRFSNYIGRNFSWTVDGELFLDRYREGDYILNGLVTKSFDLDKGKLDVSFTGKISNRTPAFWYNQWGGNNFLWSNDFNKEMRTEFGKS